MPRGSAPGERRGGRQKGTPNKRTVAEREQLEASGEMPRDYMLRVMRDPTVDHERRDRMAQAVAPYIHAKLASTEVTGKDGKDLIPEKSPREIARAFLSIIRKASTEPDGSDGERPSED